VRCCCCRCWCWCCWRGAKREEEEEEERCFEGIVDGDGDGEGGDGFRTLSPKGTAFDIVDAAAAAAGAVFRGAPPKPGGASSSSRGPWSPGDSDEGVDVGGIAPSRRIAVAVAAFAPFGAESLTAAADPPGRKCSLAQDHRPPPAAACTAAAAAGGATAEGADDDAASSGGNERARAALKEEEEEEEPLLRPRAAAAASFLSCDQRGLRSLVAASTAAVCMASDRLWVGGGEGSRRLSPRRGEGKRGVREGLESFS
jgi:hypothetical protein